MIAPEPIEALVREAFVAWPVEKVEAAATEDHDGDPVFKVTVELRRIPGDVDLAGFIPIENGVRDKAWAEGNRAFIHTYKRFDPERDFAGFRGR